MNEKLPTPPNPPPLPSTEKFIEIKLVDRQIDLMPGGELMIRCRLAVKGTDEHFTVLVMGAPDSPASRYMGALRALEMSLGEDFGGVLLAAVFIPSAPEEAELPPQNAPSSGRPQ
jgi:hypothetical protein